jgi:hypothetical protein
MKTGGSLFSKGSGMRHTLHTNLRDHLKNEKAESSVNNAVFGKVLGQKKDSDNVKIGSFGSGEAKQHIPFVPHEDTIAETLKKISFKEKKKRNNIVLEV